MTTVLDASALLALMQCEPGGDVVARRLADVAMSAVNWQEVVVKLTNSHFESDEIDDTLVDFQFPILPHDAAQARTAGLLRRATRTAGLSLGDRSCLALALSLDAPVLTADRAWADLDVGARIEVIR